MKIQYFGLCLAACASLLIAQEEGPCRERARWQARSKVETKFGIVATSQTPASVAGARILAMGGKPVDAAIAANAVPGVVEPMSDGIGGDLFAIVYEAPAGKRYGLDASGWAPSCLTIEALEKKGPRRCRETVSIRCPCPAPWPAGKPCDPGW